MKHINKCLEGYMLEQYSNEPLAVSNLRGKEFIDFYSYARSQNMKIYLSKGNIIIEPFVYYFSMNKLYKC